MSKYAIDTWKTGTERRGLSEADAAGILLAGDSVTVGVMAGGGTEQPALAVTVFHDPDAREDGDRVFVCRWSSAQLGTAGPGETEAMRQVLARAQRIADMAEAMLRGQDPGPGEPEQPPDLVHDLAAVLTCVLQSPAGMAPAAVFAVTRIRSILAIDGTTQPGDVESRVRAALAEREG